MKLIKSHDLWKIETEMELKKWRFSSSVCIKYWIFRLRAKKTKILASNPALELGRRVEGRAPLLFLAEEASLENLPSNPALELGRRVEGRASLLSLAEEAGRKEEERTLQKKSNNPHTDGWGKRQKTKDKPYPSKLP